MARDILTIPVSSVASESAFSIGRRKLRPWRSCLKPEMVRALVCSQYWLRAAGDPEIVEEGDDIEE
ncbi:hypothetical protein PsorP6_005926 [Peronosclerospora sorghi]|uniref:Uncharacterized protein n=1 Tax=Peronosclerospora sorghi TaxID=230839 RepID=A0ACC0W2U1_9STRA|nr:hypothetical protein PsorP6_005926 [Peronosclerospora sorghi]